MRISGVAVMQFREYVAMMLEVATEVVGGTPEEFRKLQIAGIEKYKRIAQAANIKTFNSTAQRYSHPPLCPAGNPLGGQGEDRGGDGSSGRSG